MANIKNELNNIKNALYGKDVRKSIHDGIDAINKEVENTTGRQVDLENTFDQLVINAGNSNAEIVDARVKSDGTSYSKLGDRLDAVDSQLAHIENKYDYIDSRDFSSLQEAINQAGQTGKELYIYGNNYITEELQVNYNMTIRFIAGSKINATREMDNMFTLNKKTKLYNAFLNGAKLANNILFINKESSELYNCTMINSLNHIVLSSTKPGISGHMIVENCKALGSHRGILIYGNSEEYTKMTFNNNEISDVENLIYYFDTINEVYINGGDFTGSPESSVNCGYKCDAVYVNGGKYYNILRGATLGKRVYKGYVKNVTAINCSYAGISIDTKEEDGTFVESQILVTDNILENCGLSIRLASRGSILYNNTSINHTDTHAYYVNEGSAIIGYNTAIGGKVYCFNNCDIKFYYDFTQEEANIQTSGTTVAIEKNIQLLTQAGRIQSTSDIVRCDMSNGGYAIKMPRYTKIIGKVYKIIKKNNISNTLAINTLDGTTINGESVLTLGDGVERVEITWDGNEWITL